MRWTKGRHAFIVTTHTDKQHIHSHIYYNSTTLDCTRKFRNFWGSSFALRRLSDRLCLENGCGKYWQSTNYAKEASMVQSVTYQSETKTVHFQGKSIVLESLTPVLSPKEKEKRKKEIERCLYEVFSKYRRASDTPA